MQDSGQIRREPMSAVLWSMVPWGANRIALFRFFAFTCTVSIRAHTHELQTFQLILSVLFLRTNGLFFLLPPFPFKSSSTTSWHYVICGMPSKVLLFPYFPTQLHFLVDPSDKQSLNTADFLWLVQRGKRTHRQAGSRQAGSGPSIYPISGRLINLLGRGTQLLTIHKLNGGPGLVVWTYGILPTTLSEVYVYSQCRVSKGWAPVGGVMQPQQLVHTVIRRIWAKPYNFVRFLYCSNMFHSDKVQKVQWTSFLVCPTYFIRNLSFLWKDSKPFVAI